MRRCAARYCPDDISDEDEAKGAAFCSTHYEALSWETKVWLASAYGTETWWHVRRAVIRLLFKHDSELRQRERDFQPPSMPW